MVLGVRTRRASANLGIAAFAVALVALALVARAWFTRSDAYVASYEWLNLQLTVTGAIQFQNLIIDLDLRIDHFAIAEIGAILLTALAVLAWSRTGARAEPGVPRLHVLVVMFVLGAVGVAVTPSLAGLFAYWGVAAAATYLMLSNRWGTPETVGARIALGIPFAGDVALLSGAAMLYSRYGELDLSRLPGLVHSTLAAGQKSLTAACLLIVLGAAARAALVPLQSWITTTASGPPPAVALVQGVWPLLAGGVVFRLLPMISFAGPQVRLGLAVVGAASAVAAPLLALAGNRFRRAVALSGIGFAGLALLALAYGDPARALLALLVGAPLRAGLVLAAASAVAALRTDDIAEMGGIRRRMPGTALALLLGAAGLPLAAVAAGAGGTGSPAWEVVYGAGVGLVAVAGLRTYVGAAHGRLERRRAFEPGRVREAASPLPALVLLLVLLGLAGLVLSPLAGTTAFLGEPRHAHLAGEAAIAFLAAAALGALIVALTYGGRRAAWLRRSSQAGAQSVAWALAGSLLLDRLLLARGRALVAAIESGLPRLESSGAGALIGSGRLLDERAEAGVPMRWVGVAVALAAVGGLLAALLSPGVLR